MNLKTNIDQWPWLGGIHDEVDQRIPILRKTPAAVRFLSMEPLVGEITQLDLSQIAWVLVGGESGAKARPMNPKGVRFVRDRCAAEDVPFRFNQWGQYDEYGVRAASPKTTGCNLDGFEYKK